MLLTVPYERSEADSVPSVAVSRVVRSHKARDGISHAQNDPSMLLEFRHGRRAKMDQIYWDAEVCEEVPQGYAACLAQPHEESRRILVG